MCARNYWKDYCDNLQQIASLKQENCALLHKLEASVAETYNLQQVLMWSDSVKCTKSVNTYHFVDPNAEYTFKCVCCGLELSSKVFIP